MKLFAVARCACQAALVLGLLGASPSQASVDVRESVQKVPDYAAGLAVWAPDGTIWSGSFNRGELARGRVAANGRIAWSKLAMKGSGVSSWTGVAVGRDGDLYWIGDGTDARHRVTSYLVRVDAASGRVRWARGLPRATGVQTGDGAETVRVIASDDQSDSGALVRFSGAGRRLGKTTVPGRFAYSGMQQVLTRGTNKAALVVNFSSETTSTRVSRVTGRSSHVVLPLLADGTWRSITPAEKGRQWVFGDTSVSGGTIGLWDGSGGDLRRAPVPIDEHGALVGRGCGGQFPQPAFRRAVVAAGDGALWARAHCWNADEEPYGPSWWLVVRPASDAPDAPLVTQVAGSDAGRVTQVSANVTVGPDAALWSIDYFGSQLLRTEVPGSPAPLAARVVAARRAGSRLLVRLSCVSEVGRVCSGTVKLKRGGRTVRSGRYFVAGQPAGIDSTTTRTFSTRGLPKHGLRASVTDAARSVAVR